MKNNEKVLKVIFKKVEKKNGGFFYKMLTILKGANGEDKFVPIRFDNKNVNVAKWENKHQLILVENKEMQDGSKNIRIPKSFEPYNYKGEMKYPYVYIQEIKASKPYEYHPKDTESHYVDADDTTFATDDIDENLPW